MNKIPNIEISKLKKTAQFFFTLAVVFCHNFSFAQIDIPEIPKFQTSVYDYANILNASEKSQLEEKLIKYSDSTTTQIVVITIESLKGEDIGILTPKWGQQWGIGGSKANDNGVIILLAKAEKKIWISAGYGLEDRLTAGIGGEIIRNVIIPEFKAGSYYNGLDKGADEIFKVFTGKYKGTRQETKPEEPFPMGLIFLIVIIVIFFISRNNSGGGFGGRSPNLLDAIILSNIGRSSGSFGGGGFGGSSGGGGFGGGFGGGGFSGGGSGGSW
jgi:uncharacterized protein